MPLTPLVEPYCQALLETMQIKIPLTSDEVEFLVRMAGNDLLTEINARHLLSVITHSYFTNLPFAKVLLRPMIDLIDRHRRSNAIVELAEAAIRQACNSILALKREEQPRKPADSKKS